MRSGRARVRPVLCDSSVPSLPHPHPRSWHRPLPLSSSSFPSPLRPPQGQELRTWRMGAAGVGARHAWNCPRVGLPTGHYKHGQFLCLSCPPCGAQGEGVAPGKYPEVCLSTPFPCKVTLGWRWGLLQCAKVAWGFMDWHSGWAAPSSGLPPAHPIRILALVKDPVANPVLQRPRPKEWQMVRAEREAKVRSEACLGQREAHLGRQ